MAERYIPLFLDFNETTQDLTNEECGRLIRALVRYANGENSETSLQGMELIAFRFMKGGIDRNLELSAVRAKAGTKGAMATNSKKQQTPAKTGKKTTKTKTNTDTKTKTESDTKTEPEAAPQTAPQAGPHPGTANNTPGLEPFLPDGEAQAIQSGHSKVLDAAQNAGFKSTPAEQAGLLNLCAAYGPERTVVGIGECVKHSAPNLAYLEAVLKGTRKKRQDPKDIHAYSQRDYSGEQQAAMERMMTMDW